MDFEKLEELMKEKDTNLYQVSKATGIGESTLYEWKAGKYSPKIDKIVTLARHFDVPLEYFLGDIK